MREYLKDSEFLTALDEMRIKKTLYQTYYFIFC